MITAILFDLDGVLVDTDTLHYQAWKELASRLGLPFTREQGNRCRGISRMDSLEILLEGSDRAYTQAEKQALAQEKNARYQQLLDGLTPDHAAPGALVLLPELRRRGYRLALASGSKNAGLILTRTGLGRFLDAVADGNLITRSKPDPEVFLTAAGLLGAAPEQCAAVDDALAGIQGARAAGMRTVGFGDAALHGAGDCNVQSLEHLLPLFPPLEAPL